VKAEKHELLQEWDKVFPRDEHVDLYDNIRRDSFRQARVVLQGVFEIACA